MFFSSFHLGNTMNCAQPPVSESNRFFARYLMHFTSIDLFFFFFIFLVVEPLRRNSSQILLFNMQKCYSTNAFVRATSAKPPSTLCRSAAGLVWLLCVFFLVKIRKNLPTPVVENCCKFSRSKWIKMFWLTSCGFAFMAIITLRHT